MEAKSLWKKKAGSTFTFPSLKDKIKTDIVVIGAGITGLTTAYLLQKAGKKVVVLEAMEIGDGTTGYSSCHLTTDIDSGYKTINSSFDERTSRLVAESRLEGINLLEKIIIDNNIECDFKRLKGYYYTEDKEKVQELEDECRFASKAGLSVSLTDNVPLPFKTVKGLVFENQAIFNSQKFINGLAHILSKTSCLIFENSRVETVVENDDYCVVGTAEGRINTNHVILATHLPLLFNVLQTTAAPYMSYVLTAKLKDNQYPEGLFWDTNDPYFYTRTYNDSTGTWLVVGGADHKTGAVTDTKKNYLILENYIRERYSVETFCYRWSAQYYEPVDGLPYIGKSPFSKKTFVATGFSGDGLVYGAIAAIIISDLIKGVENKWLQVYTPTRFTPLASASSFIKENTDVLKHFIKDRFLTDDTAFNDIKPGEGKILEKNGDKLAVARDMNNELFVLSPVCTHLKCFVQWNNVEKTWDCPCHGSRFKVNGDVMSGPAVKALENKKQEVLK
jgi:glycine/D-amino acid oxidase-like deaminating enzyme/nitrite reductase/ring-hydroxylating ferredoxin subunit